MEATGSPIKSDDTDSFEAENLICSTNFPLNASNLNSSIISSLVVAFLSDNESIARETLGVGTLIALAVNFPFKFGITLAAAEPAPVDVITILSGAARPRLGFL